VQLILETLFALSRHAVARFPQRVDLPIIAEHIKPHSEIHQASNVHPHLLKTLNLD
jgi:hypothetical protein